MSLATAYKTYTSDEELASNGIAGASAPASTPALAILLMRATMISARSSTQCAAGIAGGTPNIGNTIKRVC
ncbi:hypothetical protein [Rhodococcus sp. 14-2483-1-2]|uniref:hypothetical protein n=1 Tax=Rhodococcus sp. 14-2483-1-2 TaxID=2023147 RepID=UPI0011153F5D|nr:hypothetical protein [Rhodococcus sp. 14-2483-1-2]